MRKANLHIHTNASDDAILEPEWIFRQAVEMGLSAIAFTDHDTMANIEEGRLLSAVYGVTFLPGIEISSSWQGQFTHVLGYFPNRVGSSLDTFIVASYQQGRERVDLTLIERLRQRGVAVSVQEYEAEALCGEYRGWPLYRLLASKGVIEDSTDYIATVWAEDIRVPQCVDPPVPQVVRAIHEAGGIAVLAHPGHPGSPPGPTFHRFKAEDIALLATEGLDGVEIFHPAHNEAQERYYAQVADRLGLVKTGGSDSHYPWGRRETCSKFCDWDEVLRYIHERG